MNSGHKRRELRVVTFNIAKSYELCDVLLESCKDKYDVIFLQEPPWRTIRTAPSASSKEGDPVMGAPKHPAWTSMTRKPSQRERRTRPRVMAYVSTRLVKLRPAYRRDIVDHPDIFVLSVTSNDTNHYLMNVYNDDENSALKHLERVREGILNF